VTYKDILLDIDDPVAVITLNRPHALNAWTTTMGEEVRDAVHAAARNPSVVGLVITGAGRGFCAGADLNDVRAAADAPASEPGDRLGQVSSPAPQGPREAATYLQGIPKPVVAAINGPVAGMGVPIALACDYRIMSTSAFLTTSFAERGLVAEFGVSWLLTRLVGPSRALDLLFSARRVGSQEALEFGLVNRAVPKDEVLADAIAYVKGLAEASSPASMAAMKRQVYAGLQTGLAEAERLAAELMDESHGRPDFAEGVQAFLERRRPNFPRLGTA